MSPHKKVPKRPRDTLTAPRSLSIEVDDREKYPILFPDTLTWFVDSFSRHGHIIKIRTCRKRLLVGDYRLKQYPRVCVVERKSGINELGQNLLTDDYVRFTSSLDRLVSECLYPILFLDGSLPSYYVPTEYYPKPRRVMDALMREITQRNITIFWAGNLKNTSTRKLLGETILRLMLGYAFVHRDLDQISILKKFELRG